MRPTRRKAISVEKFRNITGSWTRELFIACGVLIYLCCASGEFSRTRPLGPLHFFPNPHQRTRLPPPPALPGRALNADPFYQKWPNPQRIPVELDLAYTFQELQMIRDAMAQIQADTKNCVRFVPYVPSAGGQVDFLSVTPLEDAGSLRLGCWSFPGRVMNQGGRGQFVGVTRGPRGCATNQREIMKVFVHSLGFRMVQNRPDRDRYIRINYENMASEWRDIDPYRKYSESQVFYRNLPFDFNSITFHSTQKFARRPMLPVYEPIPANKVIGSEPVLSRWDCVGISTMYGCNPNSCEDPYGEDEIPRRTTAGTPATPDFEEFSTFPPRTTREMVPLPTETDIVTILPTRATPTPNIQTTAPLPPVNMQIATRICRPTFKVDAAVYSEDGKIYLFSGEHFWTMDYRGEVADAGIPILSTFGGRVQPPIFAAWSNGRETFFMDASRQEITVRNRRFIRARASFHPKKATMNDAFTFNLTSGPITYYITNGGSEIQIGEDGPSTNFSSFLVVGLGDRIDAAFTIPILGAQIIGMFARNDFAYVTPCTLDFDIDPSPCFETLPVGGWPLPFSSLVSYPAGGCRRRIRLRFPDFRKLKIRK